MPLRFRSLFLAAAGVLALAGCATETPYGPAAPGGYGFTEQRIEKDRYRITFSGNSLTDRQTVETYLLFRAGELAVQNGYDYFRQVESDTESTSEYTTTTTPYPGPYQRFPGYYAYGWGWSHPIDATTRERKRYSATSYVVFGRGPKPADDPYAYDAREVMNNLRTAIVRPAQ